MKEKSTKQAPAARVGLTSREKDVARLLVDGLSNKEIGIQLDVTEKTVKFHITHIFKQTMPKEHRKDRRFITNFWKTGDYFHPSLKAK